MDSMGSAGLRSKRFLGFQRADGAKSLVPSRAVYGKLYLEFNPLILYVYRYIYIYPELNNQLIIGMYTRI